jgi:hypothetical protein
MLVSMWEKKSASSDGDSNMEKKLTKVRDHGWTRRILPALIAIFCCLAMMAGFFPIWAQVQENSPAQVQHQASEAGITSLSPEERLSMIEQTLESIRSTGQKAEERSLQNKLMARELISYIKVMVMVMVFIAIGFPLAIWTLSRKRLLGLSGLSTEVTATLLVVEERQAKLTNIMKEIQGEIDYLHTMSVPDLRNLIQQAEKYLEQNEHDLERVGKEKGQH